MMRRWGFKGIAGPVILVLASASCGTILGIDKDYHPVDGGGGEGGTSGGVGGGACKSDADCGQAGACFSWKCTDQACAKLSMPAGAACSAEGCDDGDLCTEDVCDPDGSPIHKPIPPVDDKNICTIDLCDPATGMTTYKAEKQPLDCGPCAKCNGAGMCVVICSTGQTCQAGACQ